MPQTIHSSDEAFSSIDTAANGADIVTYLGVCWRRFDDNGEHFYVELPESIIDKNSFTGKPLKTRYGPWRAWYGPVMPDE